MTNQESAIPFMKLVFHYLLAVVAFYIRGGVARDKWDPEEVARCALFEEFHVAIETLWICASLELKEILVRVDFDFAIRAPNTNHVGVVDFS
jgi:hypothetical protein